MRMFRVLSSALVAMSLAACSSSARGGKGDSGDLMEAGSGNIPLASAGKELPDVQFAYDSSALSAKAQSTLKDNARFIIDNAKSVSIEGHCDERGTSEYNLALGERRARAAFDYLRSLGVKKDQMSTISYGEELPLDPGHDEEAFAKNRRAHFAAK